MQRALSPLPDRDFIVKFRLLFLMVAFISTGCMETNTPSTPLVPKTTHFQGIWSTEMGCDDGWTAGQWDWSFSCHDSLNGFARLEMVPLPTEKSGWEINWFFQPPLPENLQGEIRFSPNNVSRWHNFRWSHSDSLPPIPIPRRKLDSSQYPDLLSFLKELTTPYFDMIVTHWPDYPIPVRLVEASNGPIDLAACLMEAAGIWNENSGHPWFVVDQNAGWGVRLVHFPDREMRPPLAARITRLDSDGRPLRISILAGNDYHSPLSRPYVVRGFVHELGHALFLWGHSLDRIHCLWGLAPPLVSEPGVDERKAARWWHGLPDGLDLSRYALE